MRSSRGAALAPAAIVLLALALRFAGLGRELPHRIEPDAFVAYELQSIERDPALVQGVRFADRYPGLLARVLALLPYPEVPSRASGPGDERAHLAAASRPFLLVRAACALASALGVAMTWWLARRFLPRPAALVAALLAATSLLSLLFSGQARPHAVQASLALAAVLAALRVRERASAGRILAAALAAAAAAATLQNGLFAFLPLAAGILLGRRGAWILAGSTCLAAGACALAFYKGLPYLDAQGIHLGPSEGGAHWIRPSLANLGGLPSIARILWEHEPVLAVLAIAGAVGALVGLPRWRRSATCEAKLDLAVVLAYALPYGLVLALDPNVYDRFLLPLIPFLACLAGGALHAILGRIRGSAADPPALPGAPAVAAGALRRAAAASAGALVLAFPLAVSLRFAQLAASKDTLGRAADWIRAHVDPKQRILTTPATVLPMLIDAEEMRRDLEDPTELTLPWLAYQRLLPDAPGGDPRWRIRLLPIARRFDPKGFDRQRAEAWIREEQADLVLVEDSRRMHGTLDFGELEHAAAGLGELAYRSDGRIPAEEDVGPADYQGARHLWRRLFEADALGPGIRIYRIRR